MTVLTAAERTAQIAEHTDRWLETDYSPENVLWSIYWIAARSEAPADYNQHIYRLISEANEDLGR